MKAHSILFIGLFVVFAFTNFAQAEVLPTDKILICSGTDEFGSYFTFSSSPRPDGKELFVVDITNVEVNDGFPLYIVSRSVKDNVLSFELQAETPYQLSIDLKTGKALAIGWIEGEISLMCASTDEEVDDILDFIEKNGLPVDENED